MYIHIYVMVRDLAGVVLGCADCAVGVLLAFLCYTQVVLDIYMQGAQHRLLSHRGLVVEASPDRLVHLEGEGACCQGSLDQHQTRLDFLQGVCAGWEMWRRGIKRGDELVAGDCRGTAVDASREAGSRSREGASADALVPPAL